MDEERFGLENFFYDNLQKQEKIICNSKIFQSCVSKANDLVFGKRFKNLYKPESKTYRLITKVKDLTGWIWRNVTFSLIDGLSNTDTIESKNLRSILQSSNHCFVDLSRPLVKWLGHSSFLVSAFGINLITDPALFSRVGWPFLGVRRICKQYFNPLHIDKPDLIVISHNHWDHFDKQSVSCLAAMNPKLKLIVPKGMLKGKFFNNIDCSELGWGNSLSLKINSVNVNVSSVPSIHGSRSSLFDENASQWCGWICDFFSESHKSKKCYYAGDTAFNKSLFSSIGRLFAPIDLSLIPVGAYFPRSFLSKDHVSPIEAVQIHRLVQSKQSIGCHHSTFRLGDPIEGLVFLKDFIETVNLCGLSDSFVLAPVGKSLNW